MRHVYIVGTAATPVAEHWERTATALAGDALRMALSGMAGPQPGAIYVANALGSALGVQAQLGPLVAAAAGLTGIEALTIEAGGASGGVALRQAALAIASGAHDLVAVVGVEKTTDVLDDRLEAALALHGDADYEAAHGLTQTAQWALLMRRYTHQYGVAADAFAPFPVNAHANGVGNKGALYRFPITADKVRAAAPVAEPLTLLDSSTVADGAAVVLLASEGLARELAGPRVRLAGTAVASDRPALASRSDPLRLAAAARSAQLALGAARLELRDVQVFDITDQHGIVAALALEAIGCYAPGTAVHAAAEGAITPRGATPIATGGGCKARGDLVGANGIYQVVELVRQLHGAAGAAQVSGARIALAQCLGGVGVVAATSVLVAE
jgi:acetyl-CoA C-acetyltransferase